MIDQELLEILACPACKTSVRLEGERLICANAACGLRYPIRDGIPVMLIEEAEKSPLTPSLSPSRGEGHG
ncbi:MAG: Trm112 family protein [Candidatus Omnitrophica bacterium]|nr:Trm112 family protein [Candidatus Omnitrophota bacterium]